MFFILKIISNAWFILSGMMPINYNRKKINFNESYIIAPNHQSFIDAALVYTSIPHLFKTLGKIEVEKAPIYGVIFKMVVVTVDRSSVTAKAKSFRKMKSEMDEGMSMVIFPEGTFPDKPQNNVEEFQNGTFALAHIQQATILPILFLDAANRMHPSKIYQVTPGLNRAVFLPPISILGVEKNQLDNLKKYCQNYMQDCLNFCREKKVKEVWDFAIEWQKNNTIV